MSNQIGQNSENGQDYINRYGGTTVNRGSTVKWEGSTVKRGGSTVSTISIISNKSYGGTTVNRGGSTVKWGGSTIKWGGSTVSNAKKFNGNPDSSFTKTVPARVPTSEAVPNDGHPTQESKILVMYKNNRLLLIGNSRVV